MNEKLTKIKNRVKNTVKDRAPELITLGVSALALVAYTTYIVKTSQDIRIYKEDPDVNILHGDTEEGFAVVSNLEALLMMEGTSKTRYKLADDYHYSFVRIETTDEN